MNEELDELIRECWGGKKPIWIFCPICDKVLDGTNPMNGFGKRSCSDCKYEYRQKGSYASLVTINGEAFGLDDMFGDGEKLHKRIDELRMV